MNTLIKTILESNNEIYNLEVKGIIIDNKLVFYDEYRNVYDLDRNTLERESDDIYSYYNFEKNKIIYYIKEIKNSLDIKIKVIDKQIKENEIIIEYITYLNEEETRCKYIINWRKL